MKEAMLYEAVGEGRVRCNLCSRRCIIPPGSTGFCRVRKNIDGKLYSLVYDKVCSMAVDPIMKKPLYHFHPGSSVLSLATVGCNFRCRFCDNWVISQERDISGRELPPQRIVDTALEYGCEGISYTYTEPTIFFELTYDTAKLARDKGLFNTYVTNGYMTVEAIECIAPYLNAATVDFKGGGNPDFYQKYMSVPSVDPVYEALEAMKKHGIHIEVTNLMVTRYGDSLEDLRKLARWICENLGEDTVFHILRFHPDYQMLDVPSTPIKAMEEAYRVAKEEGLNYIYLGNVPGHPYEDTYCPKCGSKIIDRFSFEIVSWRLKPGNLCPECGYKIAIVGEYKPGGSGYPFSLI